MVFYRRRRKFTKRSKRMYKPRKAYRKSRVPAPRNFAPFGISEAVKLRYVETVTLDCAPSVVADYIFRGNTLTTPNATAAGHQPYGFDQMMALYNSYTVVGCKMTAELTNPATAAGNQLYAGIMLSKDSVSLSGSSIATLMEQPGHGNFRLLAPLSASKSVGKMFKKLSVKKFFGVRNIVGDPDYSGNSAADTPAGQTAYFHVVIGPQQTGADLGTTQVTVTIDYYAVFTQPKVLTQS